MSSDEQISANVTSKPRKCKKCGVEFIPVGNRQVYCPQHSAKLAARNGTPIKAAAGKIVKPAGEKVQHVVRPLRLGGDLVAAAREIFSLGCRSFQVRLDSGLVLTIEREAA